MSCSSSFKIQFFFQKSSYHERLTSLQNILQKQIFTVYLILTKYVSGPHKNCWRVVSGPRAAEWVGHTKLSPVRASAPGLCRAKHYQYKYSTGSLQSHRMAQVRVPSSSMPYFVSVQFTLHCFDTLTSSVYSIVLTVYKARKGHSLEDWLT